MNCKECEAILEKFGNKEILQQTEIRLMNEHLYLCNSCAAYKNILDDLLLLLNEEVTILSPPELNQKILRRIRFERTFGREERGYFVEVIGGAIFLFTLIFPFIADFKTIILKPIFGEKADLFAKALKALLDQFETAQMIEGIMRAVPLAPILGILGLFAALIFFSSLKQPKNAF